MTAKLITKRIVDALQAGPRDIYLWDREVRGFGLKMTPKGAKTYLVQYRMGGRGSSTRRFTIGRHGSPWTPQSARQRATEILQEVRRGQDPMVQEQRRREEMVSLVFDKYAVLFVERYAKAKELRSWKEVQRIVNHDLIPAFKGRPLPEITRAEIAWLLEGLTVRAPAVARYAHAILRKLFRWAVDRGDIAVSPMVDMAPPAVLTARDRVLSDGELKAIWLACVDIGYPFGPLVQLLIATGQRIGEVSAMDWSEINLDNKLWALPSERAKNGSAHMVPLNTLALNILDKLGAKTRKRGLVFSTTGETPVTGFSKAKRRLDAKVLAHMRKVAEENRDDPEEITLPPWRYHDIRRTVATGLQRLGTRLEVTEAILNHISGSRAGIVGVYQRHNWAEEKREALEKWGEFVKRLILPKHKSS